MKLIKFFVLIVLSVFLLPFLFISCGGGGGGGSSSGSSSGTTSVVINLGTVRISNGFSIQSSTVPSGVNSIMIRISGSGMTPIQDTFNVNYDDTVLKSYQVPNGDSRLFEAFAYSSSNGEGSVLYSGSCTANLGGTTVPVTIDMQSVGG